MAHSSWYGLNNELSAMSHKPDMSFLNLVKKRNSCRQYSNRPVTQQAIERCLEAARLAPSACNSQPWYFIIVSDPDLKNRIAEVAFSGIYAMNAFAKEAPVLVVVARHRSRYAARLGGAFRGVQYSLIDLGIVCEHFALQAAEEGLGTCWLGWLHETAVKKILKLPRSAKIDVILSLGYPAQDQSEREKNRKSIEEMSEVR